ncbi:hypothetical protein BT67DRAFT_459105 [Trichocladium antarcticum]|uniref:Uncharacterized protein n=1 Tax=Trichocladium antarcticum TaxID=1450529 RepID=A0AAN6UBC6_9PEZI|nr:hypothetical protein BT67DRAFT_459105 [Trichocladium antarcticum]
MPLTKKMPPPPTNKNGHGHRDVDGFARLRLARVADSMQPLMCRRATDEELEGIFAEAESTSGRCVGRIGYLSARVGCNPGPGRVCGRHPMAARMTANCSLQHAGGEHERRPLPVWTVLLYP